MSTSGFPQLILSAERGTHDLASLVPPVSPSRPIIALRQNTARHLRASSQAGLRLARRLDPEQCAC